MDARLTAAEAQRFIRKLARDRSRISFSNHAIRRMAERRVVLEDVMRVLVRGSLSDGPHRADYSEWTCKMIWRGPERAGLTVVVLVQTIEANLLVKTVLWEELQ